MYSWMIPSFPRVDECDDGIFPTGVESLIIAIDRGGRFGSSHGGDGRGSGDEVVVMLPIDQTVGEMVQNVGKKVSIPAKVLSFVLHDFSIEQHHIEIKCQKLNALQKGRKVSLLEMSTK